MRLHLWVSLLNDSGNGKCRNALGIEEYKYRQAQTKSNNTVVLAISSKRPPGRVLTPIILVSRKRP